jgi:hypothetical protein
VVDFGVSPLLVCAIVEDIVKEVFSGDWGDGLACEFDDGLYFADAEVELDSADSDLLEISFLDADAAAIFEDVTEGADDNREVV